MLNIFSCVWLLLCAVKSANGIDSVENMLIEGFFWVVLREWRQKCREQQVV